MKLRIEKAIEEANEKGLKVTKMSLARAIWQGSSKGTQATLIARLIAGESNPKPEWVITICRECDTTPNYLYGYE